MMSNTLFEEYFKRKYNYLKDNFKAEEEKKLSFCIEQIKILENKIQDYEIKLNENNKLEYKINEITIEFDKIMILYNNLKKENEQDFLPISNRVKYDLYVENAYKLVFILFSHLHSYFCLCYLVYFFV